MGRGWGALCAVAFLLFGIGPGIAGEPAGPVADAAPAKPTSGGDEEKAGPEHGKINTADASPVDPGRFEVEASYFYSRSKRLWDRDEDTQKRELTREHCVGLAVTAGVAENLDLNISSCYSWLRDDENDYDETDGELGPRHGDHFGDLDFGARYRFLNDEKNNLEAAYIAGFTAPTGSGNCRREIGTSQEFWSFNQSLVVSKDWGKWTANAEAGYSLPFGEHRDDSRGVLCGNLAVGYQVLSWLQPELELNYEREFDREEYDPELIAGTAGLVMPVSDSMRINIGVQEGMWGRNTDKATSFFLGIKFAF